jgi:uncharacterized membrane protein
MTGKNNISISALISFKKLIRLIAAVVLLFFFILMLRITLPYFSMNSDVAFLRIKQQYLHITPWKIAFYIHVFTALLPLTAGFTQFSSSLLRNQIPIHQWSGRLYVFVILLLAGPSGLIMAFFANGGISSRLAFTILSVLWLYFTYRGWRAIRRKQIALHKNFMIRSYALTLSAITLRAWKWLIVWLLAPPPMDTYRLIAWLGFIPNLIVAEILIRKLSVKLSDDSAGSTKLYHQE